MDKQPARRETCLHLLLMVGIGITLSAGAEPDPEPTQPQLRAHAHNDYEHDRPLFDALAHGFCSVEADVHLVDGRLLVAHNRSQVHAERTLQSLYLDPLLQRVRVHGGQVYPGGPVFTLLVDFKSDGQATYTALKGLLNQYRDILTRFDHGQVQTNALLIIISGNRPKAALLAEPVRYVAYDGRLSDLDGHLPAAFMPLVSDNWRNHFRWRGEGDMPEAERQKLREWTNRIHEQGRRFRLWGTPDRPEIWQALWDAGVDLINTDNLAGLQDFLTRQQTEPSTPGEP